MITRTDALQRENVRLRCENADLRDREERQRQTKGRANVEEMQEKLNAWAIIELFGHARIAGKVSEFVIGGSSLIRVDVPAVNGQAAYTRLHGVGAIYSMTFTDEDTATRAAGVIRTAPITVYIPSAQAALQAPDEDEYDEGPEDDLSF